jgi:hypothetical protein
MEKEGKVQFGHQKIFQEVELHLKNVHVIYNGIVSKDRLIKDQRKEDKGCHCISKEDICNGCVE